MPAHDYYSRQRERIALANRDIDRQNLEALRATAREKEQEQKRMSVIGYSSDPREDMTYAVRDAIVARAMNRPAPPAAEMYSDAQGLFAQLAFSRLMAHGRADGIAAADRGRVIHLALSTSDFGYWLGNTFGGVVTAAYEHANPAYRRVGARRDLPDFRPARVLNPSDFPQLQQIGDGGSVQLGALIEGGESGTLLSYASKAALSFQALVNDDVGVLADLATAAAQRCRDLEDSLFWTTVVSNPTLRDTVAFFATARGNLAGSGAVISATTISAARAAMAGQTGPGGTKSVATPRYLVCPPALLTLAETELAKLNPGADPSMRITPIATPNLSGTAWYLWASPQERPAVVYSYLAGSSGPIVASMPHFESEGVEVCVSIDFAVTCVDPRGAFRNPGA